MGNFRLTGTMSYLIWSGIVPMEDKMKRRNFLKIVGGGMIVAGGAGAAFTMTRRPDAALAPWSKSLSPEDGFLS